MLFSKMGRNIERCGFFLVCPMTRSDKHVGNSGNYEAVMSINGTCSICSVITKEL